MNKNKYNEVCQLYSVFGILHLFMDKIKIHEISAYLIPGAIATYGFLLFFPSDMTFISSHNFSIGDFGVFTILAYSVGHIVQILGRYIEKGIEKSRGDFKGKKHFLKLLSEEQRHLIEQKLKKQKIITSRLSDIPDNQWNKIYRSIYIDVVNSEQNERINVFKNHSKLCRGLGTGIFLLLSLYIFTGKFQPSKLFVVILLILTILALFDRMRGFDKRDAEETYHQFIK